VILGRARGLPYVREFQLGVERCRSSCEFFAYCQGSHAGNRYFEEGVFSVTETEHCRTSTQALVLALGDVAGSESETDGGTTVLEQLYTTRSPSVVEMVESRRTPAPGDGTDGSDGTTFDNKPSWDNWTKRPETFKKKRVYFRKK
jgi:uncharacterized protein